MDCVYCGTEIIGYFVDQTATVCDRNHLSCLDCDVRNSRKCKLCSHSTKYCQIKPFEVDAIELVIDVERQVRPTRRRRHYFNKSETRDPLDDVIEEVVLDSEDNYIDSEEERDKKQHLKEKLEKKERTASAVESDLNIPQTQYKTENGVIVTIFEKDNGTASDDTDEEPQLTLDPPTSSQCKLKSESLEKVDDNLSIISDSNLMMDQSLSALAQAYERNVDNIILGYANDGHQKPLGTCEFDDDTSDSETHESKYPTPHAEIFVENSSIPHKIPLIEIDVTPIRSENTATDTSYSFEDGLKLLVWHNYQAKDINNMYLFVVTASPNDKRMKCLLENLTNRDDDE